MLGSKVNYISIKWNFKIILSIITWEIFTWNDWDLRQSDISKYLGTGRTRITLGKQMNNYKNGCKLYTNLSLFENLSETGCLRFERFSIAVMIWRIAFFPITWYSDFFDSGCTCWGVMPGRGHDGGGNWRFWKADYILILGWWWWFGWGREVTYYTSVFSLWKLRSCTLTVLLIFWYFDKIYLIKKKVVGANLIKLFHNLRKNEGGQVEWLSCTLGI